MTVPGGSATTLGVLYQVLATANRALSAHLCSSSTDDEMTAALLTLEPAMGGDLSELSSSQRTVFQFKARSGRRTWSLQEFVAEVLPDLYRAANTDNLSAAEYVFQTTARRGNWGGFESLLTALKGRSVPRDPLKVLDAKRKQSFFPKKEPTSQRRFFESLSMCLVGSATGRTKTKDLRTVWHLLANLRCVWEVEEGSLRRDIDRRLRELADHIEEVEDLRHRLCGVLIERSSKGPYKFQPRELLGEMGLSAIPLPQEERLRAKSTAVLSRDVDLAGYDQSLDVKKALQFSGARSLALVGESGQGKTWALASLALNSNGADKEVSVWIGATGDAERTLYAAASKLWQEIRGGNRDIHMPAAIARLTEFIVDLKVCVYVDDVQSPKEAIELFDATKKYSSLRIATTFPSSLENTLPSEVQRAPVRDFTGRELRSYLSRRDRPWADTPVDIQEILKRPLLAKLFGDVAADGSWTPASEYELFDRYWTDIWRHTKIAPHRLLRQALRDLARSVLQEPTSYPWRATSVRSAGLDESCLLDLETCGLFAASEGSEFKFWHDRVLNWAVAESIAIGVNSGQLHIRDLQQHLEPCLRRDPPGVFLGYVPMDVAYLLLKEGPRSGSSAVLEQIEGLFGDARAFYRTLAPTLGAVSIASVLQRAREEPPDSSLVPALSSSIRAVLVRSSDSRSQLGRSLNDPSESVRDIAVQAISDFPDARYLDDLWSAVVSLSRKPDDITTHHRIEACLKALRRCARLQLHWLRKAVDGAAPEHPIWVLAATLAESGSPEAPAIWSSVKAKLFQNSPSEKAFYLADCIRATRDLAELPRLVEWLDHQNGLLREHAFGAICDLDPNLGLAKLSAVRGPDLLWSHRWLPPLLQYDSALTRAAIRQRLLERPDQFWSFAQVVSDTGVFDRQSFDLLIEKLARDLTSQNPTETARRGIDLLASQSDIERLDQLSEKTGLIDGPLGEVALALAGRQPGVHDWLLENARIILLRLGGHALGRLLERELSLRETDWHSAGRALEWLPIAITPSAKDLAVSMSRHKDGSPAMFLTNRAVLALSSIGEDESFVRSILDGGLEIASVDLPTTRRLMPPLSASSLQPALETLTSHDDGVKLRGMLAVALSGNPDLDGILAAFIVALRSCNRTPDVESIAKLGMAIIQGRGGRGNALLDVLNHQDDGVLWLFAAARFGGQDVLSRVVATLQVSFSRDDVLDISELEVAFLVRQRIENCPALEGMIKSTAIRRLRAGSPYALDLLKALPTDEGDDLVWDLLIARAKTSDGTIRVRGQRAAALKRLGEIDASVALELVEALIHDSGVEDRQLLPDIVPRLSIVDAPQRLFKLAVQTHDPSVFRAISISWRSLPDNGQAQALLAERLSDPSPGTRSIAAHLSGWQPKCTLKPRLRDRASHDPSLNVRMHCRAALQRQLEEENALRLLQAFNEAAGRRAWGLLHAFVTAADPDLIQRRGDPLFIGEALARKPGVFELRALDWSEEQRRRNSNRLGQDRLEWD
jgi:hypothetical protein